MIKTVSVYGFIKTEKGYECMNCRSNRGAFRLFSILMKDGSTKHVCRCNGCGRYVSVVQKEVVGNGIRKTMDGTGEDISEDLLGS